MMHLQSSHGTSGKGPSPSPMEGGNYPLERVQGRRALIVEDETLVGWHLESVLQQLGFEVLDIVATGEEAVAAGNWG